MNVAIIGYGRMGHEIELAARDRGHSVITTIDPVAETAAFPSVAAAVDAGALGGDTVAIEFALPAGVEENLREYARAGCAVVLGTTGWDGRRERVLDIAREASISLVWGSNFSVGANMFARITAYAARLAAGAGGYDSALLELHHRGKEDSPSGTALTLAEGVLAAGSEKSRVQPETLHRRIEAQELHVASVRLGSVPGTHTLYLDSPADTVELTHRARSRHGFAVGAVQAGEWILEAGGVRRVSEFFDYLFDRGAAPRG
jgi:4-hydroxy-tetrahydrodipicolinate reductase